MKTTTTTTKTNSTIRILSWMPLVLLIASGHLGTVSSLTEKVIDPTGEVTVLSNDSHDQGANRSLLDLAIDQIDWLVSNGGEFDRTRIAIQSVDSSEEGEGCLANPNLGIVATDDIRKGDVLIRVPVSLVFSDESDTDRCDGTMTLLQEGDGGDNQSEYAPYLDYIHGRDSLGPIPSMWSPAGRGLLKTIHGPNLAPRDISDVSYLRDCLDDDERTEFAEETIRQKIEFAYATTLSRSWDEDLIPLMDMINHSSEHNVLKRVVSEETEGDDDDDDESEDPGAVEIYATRNIGKGEELFLDYMGRDRDTKHSTPELLRNFGFVEDYPQRWVLPVPQRRSNTDANNVPDEISFDVLEVRDGSRYEVRWIDPSMPLIFGFVVEHLQKEQTRIAELEPLVAETTGSLPPGERETVAKYYRSLLVAYEAAVGAIQKAMDVLPAPEENPGDQFMACEDFEALYAEEDGWKLTHGSYSSHQGVDYYSNEKKKDVCLFLEEYLHACISNRPHYHEVFVHYPAYFLEKVERVLFIGGGDSMVLHEVLKYDELELVVGLELDQHVVRSSFAHMGTQPHFHNDKVEWWFGDAAVALNALQTEYYGTFDLVVVDILSEVAESLQVTDDVTIMEAAMMLMKPNGIIVKNEDEGYVPGSTDTTKFTNHITDVVYYDVPVYCLQTFVMGSNAVDFSTKQPWDHKLSNFYLGGVDDFQAQFDTWHTSGKATEAEDDEELDGDDPSDESANSPNVIGLVMIIEAEEISIDLDVPSSVQEIIQEQLGAVGFTITESFDRELLDGFTLVSLLEEGCVTARCFADEKFCAIDVQLWKSAHRVELVKKKLLAALGSEEHSVYRVITAGIYGVEENDNNPKIGPPEKKSVFGQDSVSEDDATNQREIQTVLEKRKNTTIDFKNATTDDYDSTTALEQWESQEPLGLQAINKLELPFEYTREKLMSMVVDLLQRALGELVDEWENDDEDQIVVDSYDVGEGAIVLATWSEGTILCVWDGDSRLDINIFSLEESAPEIFRSVRNNFRMYLQPIEKDQFPRGTGRVINERRTIYGGKHQDGKERPHPFWAPSLDEDGDDEGDDES
ncbi:unnamed protein product [Pseudo-nitzschia multistriata]|uniref:SET domain-containing protein n=1 Tax=Pseudo-nitzschia multistriata TaxID=183589 RepID=A0A448YY72_9STRA|nr:unnamed protein product [Pseudo-nitzschia multistriata]